MENGLGGQQGVGGWNILLSVTCRPRSSRQERKTRAPWGCWPVIAVMVVLRKEAGRSYETSAWRLSSSAREILGSASHPMWTGGPSPAQQNHTWSLAHHVAGGGNWTVVGAEASFSLTIKESEGLLQQCREVERCGMGF